MNFTAQAFSNSQCVFSEYFGCIIIFKMVKFFENPAALEISKFECCVVSWIRKTARSKSNLKVTEKTGWKIDVSFKNRIRIMYFRVHIFFMLKMCNNYIKRQITCFIMLWSKYHWLLAKDLARQLKKLLYFPHSLTKYQCQSMLCLTDSKMCQISCHNANLIYSYGLSLVYYCPFMK